MRTLSSVTGEISVLADLEFHLDLSDQSTTFIFDRNDIISLTPLNSEISFGGGFGKPSNLNITLSTSVDFIKTYFKTMVKGTGSLKVFANSDNFMPFVGRVRDLTRFPENLSQISLNVYDRFLDSNPQIPINTITDSYSTVHPEVINADMGYPLYYGKHTRPFYMTAVDCGISNALGPINVSSENHVTSVWYNSDMIQESDPNLKNNFLCLGQWTQPGTSNTMVFSTYEFGVSDVSYTDTRLWKYNDDVTVRGDPAEVDGFPQLKSNGVCDFQSFDKGSFGYVMYQGWDPIKPSLIRNPSTMEWNVNWTVVNSSTFMEHLLFVLKDGTGTGISIKAEGIDGISSMGSVYFPASGTVPGDEILKTGIGMRTEIRLTDSTSIWPTAEYQMKLSAQLLSGAYKNYSMFGVQVNCAEIAISENPMGIVRHIIDQTSFTMVGAQNSQSQFDSDNYNFQCFFGERQSLTNILDEFGRTSANYMWAGDSGHINFNTYHNSGTLVDSGLIAATITTTDFIQGSMKILDNPLGTTIFDTQKARRVKIDYDYNFTTGQYDQSMTANPNNNIYCESANASGIQDIINLQTKYIKETSTVSLYIANVIRGVTQDEQILSMDLPARYYTLELSDVIKVQHPILPASESLYQITKINADYLKGVIGITANEVRNI